MLIESRCCLVVIIGREQLPRTRKANRGSPGPGSRPSKTKAPTPSGRSGPGTLNLGGFGDRWLMHDRLRDIPRNQSERGNVSTCLPDRFGWHGTARPQTGRRIRVVSPCLPDRSQKRPWQCWPARNASLFQGRITFDSGHTHCE
jgi:hypothetical protein